MRAPATVIAQRISRQRLVEAYTLHLRQPSAPEAASRWDNLRTVCPQQPACQFTADSCTVIRDQAMPVSCAWSSRLTLPLATNTDNLIACRPPTAAELLKAIALARGWVVGNGLPDEARAGRLLLKDYTSGKLVHCEHPPGAHADPQAAAAPAGVHDEPHDDDDEADSSYDPSEAGAAHDHIGFAVGDELAICRAPPRRPKLQCVSVLSFFCISSKPATSCR